MMRFQARRLFQQCNTINQRFYTTELKTILANKLPERVREVKEFRAEYGNRVLTEATIDMAYSGMRGIKSLVTETSVLDPNEGIRFRGLTIPECQERLPKAKDGEQPLPEAMFWLLITGDVPTQSQTDALSKELHKRAVIPDTVYNIIDQLPQNLHPMTQFSTAINLLQQDSQFAKAYRNGCPKAEYWEHAFEDSLDILAKLPHVASAIYRNVFKDGKRIAPDTNLDWAANYAHMMGFDSKEIYDCFRLYLSIHTDHEGGNVSAHTTHLVGSALSDPYLSLSAGMNGLAGPLHGLANQEVLRWLKEIQARLAKKGKELNKENLSAEIWETLNEGRVVPGFGHAVLRKTDPRYQCQREFALKHMKDYPLFQLVDMVYQIVPGILTEQGKTKNPFPNVDAHSGCLLQYYNISEEDYYTVMFGVSRAIGCLSSLVIDRQLGLPLERPKSLSTEKLKEMAPKLKVAQ
eukprot:CAMPEP_0117435900 /NCGR_PEP_ID=MMETSP0759-20121206/725_1 /TAXON_ID=63605 /ORGANISM="Percolomonas cosmopolitus, Strain WS" /LENGTH=462 /DNA_ID=CAMNT_0005227473 /DNA_START=223 /DNA_END=1611 /DNA_ORIENTATION=-